MVLEEQTPARSTPLRLILKASSDEWKHPFPYPIDLYNIKENDSQLETIRENMKFVKAQRRSRGRDFSVSHAKEGRGQLPRHQEMCVGYARCIYGCEHTIVVTF